ncbi:nuclease EXOG, mitochondrial-like [Acanthaster planci]|uniref:Endonuclease n=1 Tax=Acanthaster planci TaxID=133434 RepID=A0A8B7XSN5_ACAPL|nr:nuclease EXOG, mitochondrial-like [Acanthaster planci]
MAKEMFSFKSGFSVGFVVSLVLSFVYWGVLVADQKHPVVVPVEVYRYIAPKVADKKYQSTSPILKYGVPDRGPETLNYQNHAVGYDRAKKIPQWVAEYITKDNIKGDADRTKCSFKPDRDRVDDMFSSTLDDYSKSGYDRGHMSPAANHKYSQDAMCESFFLTNVVPQSSQHNRYYWRDFEGYCRELAEKYEEVRVITGPLFLPETSEGDTQSSRFVKYEVIGESNVSVPTHFFKVIIIENATESNTTLFAAAFLLPNEKIDSDTPLITFKVPLVELEAVAGLHFFPNLANAPVGDFCSFDDCKLRAEREAVSTMSRFSTGTLLIIVLFVWIYFMYKWREHAEKAAKNLK